jgi:hypothetical protein
MHTFFWLSKHAGFDAASAQCHAAMTASLLDELGDSFFGKCLTKEAASVREAVRQDLLYDMGYGEIEITLAQIKTRYPNSFPKAWINNH